MCSLGEGVSQHKVTPSETYQGPTQARLLHLFRRAEFKPYKSSMAAPTCILPTFCLRCATQVKGGSWYTDKEANRRTRVTQVGPAPSHKCPHHQPVDRL